MHTRGYMLIRTRNFNWIALFAVHACLINPLPDPPGATTDTYLSVLCAIDGSCRTAETCLSGRCLAACTARSCPTGNECRDGACYPRTSASSTICTSDAGCGGDTVVCVNGRCAQRAPTRRCDSEAQCPNGSECDAGYCRALAAQASTECAVLADCRTLSGAVPTACSAGRCLYSRTFGQENCRDGIDNDSDLLVDSADIADCDVPGPESGVECTDGVDNDGDRRVDRDDPDCLAMPMSCVDARACPDRLGEGLRLLGCIDARCSYTEIRTTVSETRCNDGIDDDRDSYTDLADSDCRVTCALYEICGNGIDDDRDRMTDESDCVARAPACVEPDCRNDRDDDRDGLSDAVDPDCQNYEDCSPTRGADDDRDGFADADDPDCRLIYVEICANNRDDNRNRVVDETPCLATTETREICNNGIDDDHDNLIDARDPDCQTPRRCGGDTECGAREYCDVTQNICATRVECQVDSDCTAISGGRCTASSQCEYPGSLPSDCRRTGCNAGYDCRLCGTVNVCVASGRMCS